jgi:hypothetical protein
MLFSIWAGRNRWATNFRHPERRLAVLAFHLLAPDIIRN